MPIVDFQNSIRQIHHIGSDTIEKIVPRDSCAQQTAVSMRGCGLSDIGQGYEMARPDPDFIHLLVCIQGSGWIWYDNQWRDCHRGQAYLTAVHTPHAFRSNGRDRWYIAWVYYAPDALDSLGLYPGECRLTHVNPDPIALILEGFWHETVGPRQPDVLNRWAELLHIQLTRLCDPRHRADPLWYVWAQVRNTLSEPWSLGRLAKTAGVGPEQLRRICLKHYGRSPVKQLTHLRMQQAASILLSSPDKIATVARRVGYHNEFAFSTAFRAWSGKSPGQFRSNPSR
jgi:AraC-like DNA-binding protein